MGGEERDALGKVDRRAAADGDQSVAEIVAIGGVRRRDGGFGRVGRNLEEYRRILGQQRQGLVEKAGRRDAAVADDQRPLDAESLDFLGQRLQARRARRRWW